MSELTSIAVIGVGNLGRRVVEQLLVRKAYVLTLRNRTSTKDVPKGCSVANVEYSDIDGMTRAFRSFFVSVVVCCLSHRAPYIQIAIARAAKAAGVGLFVPRETFLPPSRPLSARATSLEAYPPSLNGIGIPTLHILHGIFLEKVPWLVASSSFPGKIALVGSGQFSASFTSMTDVAGFIGHLLVTFSSDHLRGKVFRIEGQAASLKEIAQLCGKDVVRVEELDDPVANAIQRQIDQGLGRSGCGGVSASETDALSVSSNSLWPNHRWRTVADVLSPAAFR